MLRAWHPRNPIASLDVGAKREQQRGPDSPQPMAPQPPLFESRAPGPLFWNASSVRSFFRGYGTLTLEPTVNRFSSAKSPKSCAVLARCRCHPFTKVNYMGTAQDKSLSSRLLYQLAASALRRNCSSNLLLNDSLHDGMSLALFPLCLFEPPLQPSASSRARYAHDRSFKRCRVVGQYSHVSVQVGLGKVTKLLFTLQLYARRV